MKKKGIIVLLICTIVAPLMLAGVAEARQAFFNSIMRAAVYPQLEGTKFETFRCLWCHVEDSAGPRNPYGLDYEAEYYVTDVVTAAINIEQIDSDGDGYTNIEELNAATWPGFAEDSPDASMCTDNDGDGVSPDGGICGQQIDCDDNDPSIPVFESPAYGVCNDGKDNDCDGTVDCLDNSCASDPACLTCTDNDTDGYSVEGGGCGAVDCNDNNLAVSPGAVELCTGNVDDDCDGLVDCLDADCNGDANCAPTCIPEASREKGKKCSDGVDNDCDDVIDSDDPDCGGDTGDTGGTEGKGQTCSDAIDNDGDGQTDCADSDCSRNKACKQTRKVDPFRGGAQAPPFFISHLSPLPPPNFTSGPDLNRIFRTFTIYPH